MKGSLLYDGAMRPLACVILLGAACSNNNNAMPAPDLAMSGGCDGGSCTACGDTSSDVNNCGQCGLACVTHSPDSTASCVFGSCVFARKLATNLANDSPHLVALPNGVFYGGTCTLDSCDATPPIISQSGEVYSDDGITFYAPDGGPNIQMCKAGACTKFLASDAPG